MISPVMQQLIRKDLYINRAFCVGSAVAGLASVALSLFGETGFLIGSLVFITNLAALGICLGLYSIAQEKERKTYLFVMSLPITAQQYSIAKLVAMLGCFLLPWLVSGLAGLLAIAVSDIANGFMPFFVLLMFFMLQNFCIFICVALLATAEIWIVATILLTNISITLFLNLVSNLPSIREHLEGPVAVWTPSAGIILLTEIAVIILVLWLALFLQSRRRDSL